MPTTTPPSVATPTPTSTPPATPTPTPTPPPNEAPTFNFIEPNGTSDVVAVNGTFNVTWVDSDPDDDAAITMFFKAAATGACASGTQIGGTLSENGANSLAWDTTGVAIGSYFLCARIVDGTNPAVEIWSAQAVTISNTPVVTGLVHLYAKAGEAVTYGFGVVSGAAPYTFTLPTTHGDGAVSGAGVFTYTPIGAGEETFVVRVTDNDGLTDDLSFVVHTRLFRTCLWTGSTSTAFSAASNWIFCNAAAPQVADRIVVDASAPNQPTLSGSRTIDAVGAGEPAGGTITIGVGATLTLTSGTETVASSVGVQGATGTCTNCVLLGGDDVSVVQGATLTLGRGTVLQAGWSKTIRIGDGVTAGHLVASNPGAPAGEQPKVMGISGNPVRIYGTAGQRSSVDLDSLRIELSAGGLDFVDHFEIKGLDSVTWNTGSGSLSTPAIRLLSCADAVLTDATWDDFDIQEPFNYTNLYNIDASGCSAFGPVTINGDKSSVSYGAGLENDPNGVINWVDGASHTCVWNGSVSTAWTTPGNWTACGNNRGNYPDQGDYAVIATGTPYAPTISATTRLLGFGLSGGGGGAVSIAPGATLVLYGRHINSDVTIQGTVPSCTTCLLYQTGNLQVINNATLTLGSGATVQVGWQAWLMVGNITTRGHLATLAASGDSSEWPRITGGNIAGVLVRGASNTLKSSINVDGLRVTGVQNGTSYNAINFSNYYDIQKFDNVIFDFMTSANDVASGVVSIDDCSSSTITDTTWSNITMTDGYSTGNSFRATTAACAATANIVLVGQGTGFGEQFDDDPNNHIYFHMDLAAAPTYPEAKQGALWTQSFAGSGGTGPYSYAIPTNPGGASINAAGSFTYTPGGGTAGTQQNYVVQVTDANGNIEQVSFVLDIQSYYRCRWTGATTTTWATAGNWATCGGLVPQAADRVLIDAAPVNQPAVLASTTIDGFAAGTPNGGTVTVSAGMTLTLSSATGTIGSSVKFRGDTTTCSTCIVAPASHMSVVNNAVLTLGMGITLDLNSAFGRNVNIGDGVTAGHLRTDHGSTAQAEWPILTNSGTGTLQYVNIFGTSPVRSSIDVNGIRFLDMVATEESIQLQNYWTVTRFDNVQMDGAGAYRNGSASAYVLLTNCGNGTMTDTTWSGLDFVDPVPRTTATNDNANIKAATCTGLPTVTVSGTGVGFGAAFEDDPNNIFNWTNGATFVCTWTGTTSSSWTNPTNWSGCINGRSNYPDQLDRVIIPPLGGGVVYQPEIGAGVTQYLFSTGNTSGGGTITVQPTGHLFLLNSTTTISSYMIGSSVTFKGGTTTCSTCYVDYFGYMTVVNNATLTLGKGITLRNMYSGNFSWLYIGNASAGAGHLVTTGGASNEWPVLMNAVGSSDGIYVSGASGALRSTINVDGLKIKDVISSVSYHGVNFSFYFNILKFDNVSIDAAGASAGHSSILLGCSVTATNTQVTDTTWSNLEFVDSYGANGYNINASDSDCTAANGYPAVTVTGSGSGYGEQFDNDPAARFSFHMDLLTNPAYTEAKQGSQWSQAFTGTSGTGPYTYAIPTNPGAAAIDSSGVLTYTPGGGTAGTQQNYVVEVTDANGNIEQVSFVLDIQSYYRCRWTGASSVTWATAGNWATCGGNAPQAGDRVLIDSAAGNQPTVAASTTIDGFASGTPSGGTVTIGSNRVLTLSSATATVASPVTVRGATAGCTDCFLDSALDFTIINGAVLTLGTGIRVRVPDTYRLLVGNATDGGGLATLAASGTASEWPVIQGSNYLYGIIVEGGPGSFSSLNLDGIVLSSAAWLRILTLQNYYRIEKLDNVTFETDQNSDDFFRDNVVTLLNCANGTFNDSTWSNLTFDEPILSPDAQFNISLDTTTCSGVGPFVVSGSGRGYGSIFEEDVNNLLTWTNGASFNCVWDGSDSTSWVDPDNWTGCANGRNGYPDQNDVVEIPPIGGAVTVQPVFDVPGSVGDVYSFAGSGGGTLTIGSGKFLSIRNYTDGMSGQLTVQGATTTCADCSFGWQGGAAFDGTLTLLKGITLVVGSGNWDGLVVGPGGNLNAQGGVAPAQWPTISTRSVTGWDGIWLTGAGATLARLAFDGVNILDVALTDASPANREIHLDASFELVQFDNVTMNPFGAGAPSRPYVQINCTPSGTNALVSDTTWTNILFADAPTGGNGANIHADDADCTAANGYGVTVVGDTGGGWGQAYEKDNQNVLTWTP